MASGFESLAPELLLCIVTKLLDLVCLDSLIRASPAALRLFEEYAVEITEAVLTSPGVTHRHTAIIIRVIALIRSGTLPIQSLHDFRNHITEEAMFHRKWNPPPGFAPDRLAASTHPATLRSILATNRQLVGYSFDLLALYLSRFRPLRPKHPVGLPRRKPLSREVSFPNGLLGAQSTDFKVRDVGPPSWQEEQRVLRAFWRLQIFCDLKTTARSNLLNWPKEDLEIFVRSSDPVAQFYRQGLIPCGPSRESRFQIHPEYDEITSVVWYVRELTKDCYILPLSGQDCIPPLRPGEAKRDWPMPLPHGQDWSMMMSAAAGPAHYNSERINARGFRYGFRHTGPYFQRYGQFGFAFWDYERLCAYGFKPPIAHDSKRDPDIYYFAWHSILGVEEIKEADRTASRF